MTRTATGNLRPATDSKQQIRLFRVYNYYRLVVSLLLVVLLLADPLPFDARFRWLSYYQAGVVSYLALNIFIGLLLMTGFRPGQRHITVSILLDILIMHGLLVTSTGITNGLANLVIVSVAAGNILTPSRMGTFYAALATICSLGIAGWGVIILGQSADTIVRAGSLGILYFAAAFLLQYISRRLTRSEALASSRARSIAELQQINQQIIQRMRTGILVVDGFGQIRLANAAAEELLFGCTSPSPMLQMPHRALPDNLQQGLDAWLQDPEQRPLQFRPTPASPQLQATFALLDQKQSDLVLVFVEDLSRITQQAQQMKLASLGRLTASIAHEIRNPLGAISPCGPTPGRIPPPGYRRPAYAGYHPPPLPAG